MMRFAFADDLSGCLMRDGLEERISEARGVNEKTNAVV